MRDFKVTVTKLTGEDLMRKACESTFIGTSRTSLATIYKSEHSPARTQMFWIELVDLELAVATHLIRHHVGSQPFQLTCRNDRKGGNPGVPERCEHIIANLESSLEAMHSGSQTDAETLIMETVADVEWLAANSDRRTPVNLSLFINAQSLIDMSKVRMCMQAHVDTRKVFNAIKDAIKQIDPDLSDMMVRKCVYRNGLCGEPRCCGFNGTEKFADELAEYVSHFTEKQRGL